MRILIVHLGVLSELLPSTSIIKGLLKKIDNPNITWVINSPNNKYIFNYNKNINRVLSFQELEKIDETFDVLINLHPYFPHEKCKNLKIKDAFDFNFQKEFGTFANVFEDKVILSNINIFQMYYKLAGLTWKGEGYDIYYYPHSKQKRNKIGISFANINLRNYVIDTLHFESSKLWYIPHKKNIFKRIDEINKCEKIITDDIITCHLAVYLRKYVYFLKTFPLNVNLEFFGKGEIINVPKAIVQ